MTRPDSRLSRLRRSLARAIDTMPPSGEAWCIDCQLNGGHTTVLSACGIDAHLQAHDRDGSWVRLYCQSVDLPAGAA